MPKLASFRVKLVNFPSEKGRFGCLLRSHFGSNRLCKRHLTSGRVKLVRYYSSIKDALHPKGAFFKLRELLFLNRKENFSPI